MVTSFVVPHGAAVTSGEINGVSVDDGVGIGVGVVVGIGKGTPHGANIPNISVLR